MAHAVRRGSIVALLLAAGLALVSGPASAQSVRATVNRSEITVEDQIELTVTVEGARSATPVLPDLPDFEILEGGRGTQLSFVNGRTSSSITFSYTLVPKRPGTFTIGPVTVDLEGSLLRSEPFQVRVLKASATPSEGRDLFTTVQVSTDSPYVGQQVIYTWRLYRRVRIADARLEPLEFEGFLVEDLGEVREYETSVRGQAYVVSEIRKALFPQEEGTLEIPASRLTCQVMMRGLRRPTAFDDFFGTGRSETRVVRTQPITIEARPLPAAPPGFSGLVGRFELGAKVSRTQLAVGESATVELTVRGTGNVQMIGEPPLPELPAFKIYDDKPRSSIEREVTGVSGYKSFRKALVPLEAGTLTLPGLSLTYFDPASGSYELSRTPPIALEVVPGDGPEELRLTESMAPTTGKVRVRILADDILPLHRGVEALAPAPVWSRSVPVLGGGLAAPALLYLGALAFARRRRRFAADSRLRRRAEAMRKARAELRRVAAAVSEGDGAAAVRRGSRCLREFIGDKLGIEGSALTPLEVDQTLRGAGVAPEVVKDARQLLERFEAARYAATATSDADPSAELTALLKSLDRELKA